MYLLKDKKAVLKFSFLTLALIAIVAIIVYAGGVFATGTHTSTVEISPDLVQAYTEYLFTTTVTNTGGDPIHEFRIYWHGDFTSYNCQDVSGWDLYIITSGEEYYCQYVAKTSSDYITAGNSEDFTFYATTPDECCRNFKFETRDPLEYYVYKYVEVCVDDTEPETTKTFDGPQKLLNCPGSDCVEWIDSATKVVLTPTDDVGPHDTGVEGTWYKNILVEGLEHELGIEQCDSPCEDLTICNNLKWFADDPDSGDWVDYFDTGPFTKEEESCHILYYYSEDGVGNEEDVKVNCFYVDKTPPEGTKEVGEPKILCNDDESVIGNELELILENKDSSWQIINDGTRATLKYNDMGPEFNYSLEATGLQTNTEYSLIYYADFDPRFEIWGGNNPGALITTTITDGSGSIDTSGSTNLGMNLPSSPDWNINPDPDYCDMHNGFDDYAHCAGAKIWLVPSIDYNNPKLTAWNPDDYLFETDLIDYTFAECYWVRDPSLLDGTPITLTCTDQEPHPSGDEEVCYKVSFDGDPNDLTDQYCDETLEDGWCCVDSPETIIFVEDSLHDLEYFCRDAVNKKSEIDLEWFRVDSVPPEITKIMIGTDHFGYRDGILNEDACPPKPGENDECYVADHSGNGVRIDVSDPDPTGKGCNVDEVTCTYELWWNDPAGSPTIVDSGSFGEEGKDIIFTKDSTHTLKIHCEDALGNYVDDEEEFLVDSTPPVTTKTYGEPTKVEGDYRWITSKTPIYLTPVDEKVGTDKLYWRNTILLEISDGACIEECSQYEGSGDWNIEDIDEGDKVTIYKPKESCHLIEFYSVDLLGNEENTKRQCVYVDNTPPISIKDHGTPLIPGTGFDWVTQQTPILLSCEDQGPHPVDHEILHWRFSTYTDGFQGTPTYSEWYHADTGFPIVINFPDDCWHDLEYYCTDSLGNAEAPNVQYYIVDTQPPIINKTIIGPRSGDCPPEPGSNDICYIDGETVIEVNVTDPEPHPVGRVTCDWEYTVNDGGPVAGGTSLTPPFDIIFPEESEHDLTITCRDALGNTVTDVETFFVDKTPPVTEKWYDGPKYSDGLVDYSFAQTIPVSDGTVGNLVVTVTDEGDWMVWTFDFPVENFTGDGNLNVGLIIATDGEGNGPAYQIHNNDGADSGYAWGTWLYSEYDNGWHSGTGGNNVLVSGLSWVEATGNKNVPHGDGILQVKILKSELGVSFHWAASPTVGSGFNAPAYDVTMQIPSAFGWSNEIVEMTQPNYEYAKSVMGEYPHWITSDTLIHLTPVDEGIHKSGIRATYWRNTLLIDDGYCRDQKLCQEAIGEGEWNLYDEPFTKGEESCHLIEYYSIDNVNKTETVKKQCVFVDNQPPTPLKEVGEPKTEWDGQDSDFYPWIEDYCWNGLGDQIECWKVTLDTEISMTCEDPTPHPVDNERICFNVELDGDDWTESYCTQYNGDYNETGDGFCCLDHTIENFIFLETSEHNLKFYCVDALENKGPVDEEKFKVEGNDFEIQINKKWNLISVPVVLLNPDITEVIPDSMGDIIKSVWTYDAESDKWYVYTPDGNGLNDNLHELIPGWGYWVLAKNETKIVIGGSLLSPGRTPPSRNLVEGWNLIGYYGLNNQSGYYGPVGNGDDVVCALGSLCGPLWFEEWSSVVTYWQPNSNPWVDLGRYTNMDPGAGYWVFMRDSGEYGKATGCCSFLGP